MTEKTQRETSFPHTNLVDFVQNDPCVNLGSHTWIAAHFVRHLCSARGMQLFLHTLQRPDGLSLRSPIDTLANLYNSRSSEARPFLAFTFVPSSFLILVRILPLITAGFPPPWSLVLVAFWLQPQFLVLLGV